RPVPADVPVGHLLPARDHARLAPVGGHVHAAHVPRRRPPPGHGRWRAIRAARRRPRGPRWLARRLPRDLGPLLPLAVTARRTPCCGCALRGLAGAPPGTSPSR